MAGGTETLEALRLSYQLAYVIYKNCRRARHEVLLSDRQPSNEMLEREAAAGRALIEARAEYVGPLSPSIARKGPLAVTAQTSAARAHAGR